MATDDNPQLKPKKSVVAGETVEEHTLADRVAFERHQSAQGDAEATPQNYKLGLGIFRTRVRNGRP